MFFHFLLWAISPGVIPLALISTTFDLLYSNWSDFMLKVQKFPSDIRVFRFLALSAHKVMHGEIMLDRLKGKK
jgi:hypothetical protein